MAHVGNGWRIQAAPTGPAIFEQDFRRKPSIVWWTKLPSNLLPRDIVFAVIRPPYTSYSIGYPGVNF